MNERNQIYKKKINLKFEKVRDDVLENSIYDLQTDFNIKPNFDVYYYKVENTEHYEFEIEYNREKFFIEITTLAHILNTFKISSIAAQFKLELFFMLDTTIQELVDYSMKCLDILKLDYPYIYQCKTKTK